MTAEGDGDPVGLATCPPARGVIIRGNPLPPHPLFAFNTSSRRMPRNGERREQGFDKGERLGRERGEVRRGEPFSGKVPPSACIIQRLLVAFDQRHGAALRLADAVAEAGLVGVHVLDGLAGDAGVHRGLRDSRGQPFDESGIKGFGMT